MASRRGTDARDAPADAPADAHARHRALQIVAGLAAAAITGVVVAYGVTRHQRAAASAADAAADAADAAGAAPPGSPGRTASSFPTSLKDTVGRCADGGAGGGGGGDDDGGSAGYDESNDDKYDDYPINVGSMSVAVDTRSQVAQKWFDRGINWAANYHREEAAYCFRRASTADGRCAMAFWGLALVNGPDYNFHQGTGFYELAKQPTGYPSLHVATAAAQTACALARGKQWAGQRLAAQRALVDALPSRYEWPVTQATPELQKAYAAAMRTVAARFPNDPLVAICQAEAVMCLSPWKLYQLGPKAYDPNTGAPGEFNELSVHGREALDVLNRGLRANPRNVWLAHLKVHVDEMGPVANFDWDAANLLRDAEAAGTYELGHLLHMPTHLDIQVGDYASAMSWNVRAWKADMKLFEYAPERFSIYIGYLVHNLEFCAWAGMYGANYATAMKAVQRIEAFVTDALISSSERVASVLELYRTTRLMVMIRFGRWDDILATAFRNDRVLFRGHTLFLHYARGIAYGARGLVDEARAEQRAFEALRGTLRRAERVKHNVDLVAMGEVAHELLDAEIKYREDDLHGPRGAFASARRAVERFDALPYDEPHGWLMSPRQTLGALLTEKDEFSEATDVYRQDLHLFPRNIWALVGLRRCVNAALVEATGDRAVSNGGQEDAARQAEALQAELQQIDTALRCARETADVEVGASCACALQHWVSRSDGTDNSDVGGSCCGGSSAKASPRGRAHPSGASDGNGAAAGGCVAGNDTGGDDDGSASGITRPEGGRVSSFI